MQVLHETVASAGINQAATRGQVEQELLWLNASIGRVVQGGLARMMRNWLQITIDKIRPRGLGLCALIISMTSIGLRSEDSVLWTSLMDAISNVKLGSPRVA
jgi:hypothetical protein